MRRPKIPARPVPTPCQLRMPLDRVMLRGVSSAERAAIVMRLACLLAEAAGLAVKERGDDER